MSGMAEKTRTPGEKHFGKQTCNFLALGSVPMQMSHQFKDWTWLCLSFEASEWSTNYGSSKFSLAEPRLPEPTELSTANYCISAWNFVYKWKLMFGMKFSRKVFEAKLLKIISTGQIFNIKLQDY